MDQRGEGFLYREKIIGRDVLLSYPNFNEEFIIHTGAIKAQLRGEMSQTVNPIDFY